MPCCLLASHWRAQAQMLHIATRVVVMLDMVQYKVLRWGDENVAQPEHLDSPFRMEATFVYVVPIAKCMSCLNSHSIATRA